MKKDHSYNLNQNNRLEVGYQPNIYDELAFLKERIFELEERFAKHLSLADHLRINDESQMQDTMSIQQIIKQYGISRQSFWLYRKHVQLEPAAPGGKAYRLIDIEAFFRKVADLRKKQPELFISNSLKQIKNGTVKLHSRIKAKIRGVG